MAAPVTIIAAGGIAVTNTANAAPFTVTENGIAVTLVDAGGVPVTLFNEDGSPYPPAAFAAGVLSFNGNVSDGESIVVGETIYTFVQALADAYDVLIGASASITINNTIAAITAGAGEGTVYGTGTVEHPDVTASASPGVMNVTAKVAGAAGNSIATTSSAPNATWGAATLQGGA